MSSIHRRAFLGGLASLPIASSGLAFTDLSVGSETVTALSDGHLTVPTGLFSGLTGDAQAALGQTVQLSANTYAYRTGERIILFDAGAGQDYFISEQFPETGQLPNDLTAAAITPSQVTDIILTHMHIDHIGGLVSGGQSVFPNAEIHLLDAEWAFWTRENLVADVPDPVKPMAGAAQQVASIIRSQVSTYGNGADLGNGINLLALPGHTPGHAGVLLSGGNEQLLLVGDAIVSDPVHFAYPEAEWALEFDKDVAFQTRVSILDRAAADRVVIAGSHLSGTGTGHVERDGGAYRFVARS